MEFKEYYEKRSEIIKELNKLELDFVYSKTKLRIGDVVKFIEKGDSYIGEKDQKHKGKIHRFEVSLHNVIYVHCEGIHYRPLLENVKKCRF